MPEPSATPPDWKGPPVPPSNASAGVSAVLLAMLMSGCGPSSSSSAKDPHSARPTHDVGDDVPGGAADRHETATRTDGSTATANDAPTSRGPGTGCIILGTDFESRPVSVEGTLALEKAGPILHLTHAQCVVGLEHANYLTEVYVASTGPDVRPLANARVRISGAAIAGKTDLGGPAVVVMATSVERVP